MAAGLTRAAFETYFNDSGTGKFKDGQAAGAITEAVDRDRNTKIKEASTFFEDFAPLTTAGTATAYTVTTTGYGTTKYVRPFIIKMHATNTGSCTLNPDGAGAVSILKRGSVLRAGDLVIGQIYQVAYDGTNFQLLGYEDIKSETVVIPAVEVLNLNSAWKTLVPAPGSNLFIVPIDIKVVLTYDSAAYATNTTLIFRLGSDTFANLANVLDATVSTIGSIARNEYVMAFTNAVDEALTMSVDVGNPTAGDSPLRVHVTYKVFST